jgi:hypothetical protein
MTGPEHYKEAEYLLASSIHLRAELLSGERENEPADYDEPDRVVALAQVHATLALAAATALEPHDWSAHAPEWRAWVSAAGTPEVTP